MNHYTHIDDDENSTSSDGPGIDNKLLQDELSGDTLAALMQFMTTGSAFDESDADGHDNAGDEVLSKDTICFTYTENDNCVIAETLQRLRARAEESALAHQEVLSRRKLLILDSTMSEEDAVLLLRKDGIIQIDGVLDSDLCDICLKSINQALLDSDLSSLIGFGKVHSRDKRYDMYLPNDGPYQDALRSMLCKGSELSNLFLTMFENKSAIFHELSALISDSGSESQPIHPDVKYTDVAPSYTCFVALQDIDDSMGPTVFLPRTNSRAVHERYNANSKSKDALLAESEYRLALLKKGNVAIMDSRTLHSGGANCSVSPERRRVLLYFTLRNPLYLGEYAPCGSLIPGLSISTEDFLKD